MTEKDKYALKEFLRGAGVFVGASVIFIVILIAPNLFVCHPNNLPLAPAAPRRPSYTGLHITGDM